MEQLLNYELYTINIDDLQIIVTKNSANQKSKPENTGNKLDSIHFHSGLEFFFVTEEPLIVNTDKQRFVFNEGLVVIPAFLMHFSSKTKNTLSLGVKFEKIKNKSSNGLHDKAVEYFLKKDIFCIEIPKDVTSSIAHLKSLSFNSCFDKEAKIKALLTLVFTSLFDEILHAETLPPPAEKKDILFNIDLIITHELNENLTAKKLAEKLFLSTKQVSRIIKKHYNCTITELINKRKLAIAVKLLTETNLSIAKIIDTVGYPTPNYFFKIFKKHYGVSPLSYRKNSKQL